ncbi:hypothetical protein HK097_002347 [Rhizophlyctis rosea]|uniref:Endonuclease/exonuclease/phosphatase domain-containing protein n=1 Tax=Rhizophlyctis rosea TaxID=64517 RepID=A0AAD5SGG9_9FUNG|nr:hypothetical protein HK097_002347 [Rhizophlyctis rosea]
MTSTPPYPSSTAVQTPLTPLEFSFTSSPDKWLESLLPKPTPTPSSSIKILTYNIWFDNLYLPHRWLAILSLIAKHQPEVVCIQEATEGFINLLKNDAVARERYIVLKNFVEGSWYGCLILVDRTKLDIVRATSVTFPTQMGRALIVVEVIGKKDVSNLPLCRIATSHFESMHYSSETRFQQFTIASQIVKDTSISNPFISVVCGDTNLELPNEVDLPQQVGFRDSWLDTHPEEEVGHTWGITYPKMMRGEERPRKLDRVLYLEKEGVKVVNIGLVGDQPVEVDGHSIYPSDHIGIVAEFDSKKE